MSLTIEAGKEVELTEGTVGGRVSSEIFYVRPVLGDPAYDELHRQVSLLEAVKPPKTEKTPLSESADNICTIVKETVGHMGDSFPGGTHFPDFIWLENFQRVTVVNQTAQLLASMGRSNGRSMLDGRTAQLVAALDRRGDIKILEAYEDERNDYGELDLNRAASRDATDEEIIHWVSPLMEIVIRRLESDRVKSIVNDLRPIPVRKTDEERRKSIIDDFYQVSKGEVPKKDSDRTRELTRQLIKVSDAKDLVMLELIKHSGGSNSGLAPARNILRSS